MAILRVQLQNSLPVKKRTQPTKQEKSRKHNHRKKSLKTNGFKNLDKRVVQHLPIFNRHHIR